MALKPLNERLTAQNVFLDENTGGKGRYFKARILQPGLVKYSFGVCLLEKETIEKFIYNFVGCPVIIGHNDVTEENKDQLVDGNICHIWFDQVDGWYWVDGIINSQEALDKIEQGYNVSCQYEITEYSNNTENKLHNGNPYDKVILNGKPEHLAIVETPRYENAMIAVNALDLTEPEEKEKPINLELIKKAINEIKDTEMFKNLFKKENKMDEEKMKNLFMDCLVALQAKNEEDEAKKAEEEAKAKAEAEEKEEDKKDEKAENGRSAHAPANACKNEDVDKRDIIRKIAAIAGLEEDDEKVRTIIKLAEELAYDKSEAGTADNAKKGKNEEKDEKEKEEKEEAKNKAKNSIDEMKNLISSIGTVKASSKYVTKSDAIALGDKLFG